MARLKTQIRTEVETLIQNKDKVIEPADINYQIDRAVRVLSRRNPRRFQRQITGDGSTQEWLLASASWVPGMSSIEALYYPWDDTDTPHPPAALSPGDYAVYEKTANDETTYYLRLENETPSSSEYVRLIYVSPQAITDSASTCTITNPDWEDAVILLAASFCLKIMAARAIALSNSAIGADTVDYGSRSQQYLSLSDQYRGESGLAAYLQTDEPPSGLGFFSMGTSPDPVQGLGH